MDDLHDRLLKIRLVSTDVDGVLTDGSLHYHGAEGHTKVFNVKDGAAIKYLQSCGIPVAFISGLESISTWARASHLGVTDCYTGHLAKRPALDELCEKYSLTYDQIVHIGDDLPDLALLSRVGLACCPEDAVADVKAVCHWTVPVPGGRGVLRAVAERILKAQGLWDGIPSRYLG